ncbi:cysteine hydrolase family protein [Pontibacillus marinus]|uniref:Isochorismatase n=1 Tax=Pontibacillus marinus BH030004 = DSM 16465 TaxID=1385511 RepID=A0A0A5FVX6_9BACI|nr:cysteine hydrolase family protein [Pontibacillus marinus]KGX84946.1 isochorismatase [Pontibacillus marinus BH030004 = DSM 16465]
MAKALVVIDMQKFMFREEAPAFQSDRLIERVQSLLKQARETGTPIIYIQHNAGEGTPLEYGTTNWEIDDRIGPMDKDIVIHKTTPDSFYQTALQGTLDQMGVNHLMITGIQTEACVDTTTRSAFGKGYEVTVVTDAHSTFDTEDLRAEQIIAHHNKVLRWFAHTKETKDISFEVIR